MIDTQAPAQYLIQNFRPSLQDARDVDEEKDEGEYRVNSPHRGAIAVLHHLGRGGTPNAAEHRRQHPVKGHGKEILPLIPDR